MTLCWEFKYFFSCTSHCHPHDACGLLSQAEFAAPAIPSEVVELFAGDHRHGKPPGGTEFTSESALGFDHRVQRGRLDGLGQELPDPTQPQQLDAQGDLVKGSPEHLRSQVSLEPGMRTKDHFSEL